MIMKNKLNFYFHSSLKKNRIIILLIDLLCGMVFFLPLLLRARRPARNSAGIERILVMELWGIGDLVIMSACLPQLKALYPKARISLLAKAYAQELLERNRQIDSFFVYDFPWTRFAGKYRLFTWNWPGLWQCLAGLRSGKFDLIIDARADIRNNLLSFLIGAPLRVGFGARGGGYFLTQALKIPGVNSHRLEAWKALLESLGGNGRDIKPQIQVSDEDGAQARQFLSLPGANSGNLIIGIHPGARLAARRWPLKRFRDLAMRLKAEYSAKIVWFIEPDGYGSNAGLPVNTLEAKLSLRAMIAVIKHLDLFICNDGGPMHIAGALDKPVVAVFGPTSPQVFGPLGEKSLAVFRDDVACRPCFDYCADQSVRCLETISVDEVYRAACAVLSGNIRSLKEAPR